MTARADASRRVGYESTSVDKASPPDSYHPLILKVLYENANLTVRGLESLVSRECVEMDLWMPGVGARFDYDLESLMLEGLVTMSQGRYVVITEVGRALIQDVLDGGSV